MENSKDERWLTYRKNHVQFLIRRAEFIFSLFVFINAVVVLPKQKWSWTGLLICIYFSYSWFQERRHSSFNNKECFVKLVICTALTTMGVSYTEILYQLLLMGAIINIGKGQAIFTAVIASLFYLGATVVAIPVFTAERIMHVLFYLLNFAVVTVAIFYLNILVKRQLYSERQMKELARENDIKQKMVITDDLTGLYNYRAYKEMTENLPQYALAVIDVDYFKKLNDTYGHGFGNQVLIELGEIIRGSIRSSDMAFRYGGEEFVLVLPEATGDLAFRIAERLRRQVEETSFSYQALQVPVTISVGIAVKEQEGSNQEVFEEADSALYHAKQQGRNNVQAYISTMERIRRD